MNYKQPVDTPFRRIFHRLLVETAGLIRKIRGIFRLRRQKKILFVADNILMSEHLAPVWNLLKDDPRLDFYLLDHVHPHENRPETRHHIHHNLPLPLAPYWLAYFTWWDLIVVADHSKPNLVDKRWGPTLRIQHGIAAGRIDFDGAYTFNRYTSNIRGQLRYSRMFVSSEKNRQLALRSNPALQDAIAVVGNFQTDTMLDLVKDRVRIRHELGFKPEDKVVFVLSSWGPHSLFNTIGDAFLAEARKLTGEFSFILNVHPNEYQKKPKGERVWGEYLRRQAQYGFTIREIYEPWMPFMVASDIVISDYTSLVLHAVLLERPIIQSPLSHQLLGEGTLAWRLQQFTPKLDAAADNLRGTLLDVSNSYPTGELRRLATDINTYPGQFGLRAKREIYELLNLGAM